MSDPQIQGLDAEQILNSTVFKNTMDSLEKTITNSIKKTPYDGLEATEKKLEHYYAMLRVVDLVKSQLTLAMTQGRVEGKKIERIGKKGFTL